MVSSVTGRLLSPQECVPSYWKQNMISTVRFAPALEACLEDHSDKAIMVEIGPHPALKGPVQETLRANDKDSIWYCHSCYRGSNDFESLLETTGAMLSRGIPLDTVAINSIEATNHLRKHGIVLTDLPTYPWNHSTSFWSESRISRSIRGRQFPRHLLLGSRYLEDLPTRPSWRNHLMLREVPWLAELRVCYLVLGGLLR